MSQEPYAPPNELKLAREYGTTRGILDGQRDALSRVEAEAYLEAYHSQLRAAGLCRCDEIAAAQASARTDLQGLSDTLAGYVAELGRIAGLLQPKPVELEPIHAPELAKEADSILAGARSDGELPHAVSGFLAGLGERARARREAKVEQEAGRQVDADETPAVPAQKALDDDPLATPFLPRRVPNLAAGGIVQPPITAQQ